AGGIHRLARATALLRRRETRRIDRPGTVPATTSMEPKHPPRPLLMVDIDGVISLFANGRPADADGAFHSIEGIPHFLSATAAAHLLDLRDQFELVWCSGWGERAGAHPPDPPRVA